MTGTSRAAANVAGRETDVNTIAASSNKYKAHSFFDQATDVSCLDIDMNPSEHLSSKDAIFTSRYKMFVGVNTPGL